jgi:hypothetical protein
MSKKPWYMHDNASAVEAATTLDQLLALLRQIPPGQWTPGTERWYAGDEEIWHGAADSILIRALEVLAGSASPAQADQVRELIALYDAVPKWYG